MPVKRWNVYSVLVLVWTLIISPPRPAKAICVEEGQVAPDFALESIDGELVSLSSHRGKVALLPFWASWCPRCLEELTFLRELGSELSDDIVVLAVNQETQLVSKAHVEVLKHQVAGCGVEHPVLLDKDLEVWSEYCINALPTSVIVDREGEIRFAEPNYYWASKEKITKVLSGLGVLTNLSAMVK
jgi:peroxiredoxin